MLNDFSMISLVMGAGLLDGLSPCVIAILIFFIAFLLSLQRALKNILFLGLVYIFVVFLTYLSVGVGLFSGIMFFGRHHFFAEFGSWILIIWGVIYIKDYFFPKLPPHIHLPKIAGAKTKFWLEKATLPSVIVAAFAVGLCSVPCSAGLYTAITSLLAAKTTYAAGFLYLILYNLMVIAPLLVLLLLTVNPLTLAKLAEFRQKNARMEKLAMGLLMIGIGLGILIFFM